MRRKYERYLDSPFFKLFVLIYDDKPIGYAQAAETSGVGNEWWPSEPLGTWAIDLFLSERDLLAQGLGTNLLEVLASTLFTDPTVRRLIVDPSPSNTRAIRSAERAGFQRIGERLTPDGPALILERWA
jgi:RimJ/RimL family protein N-acetyltransferase